MIETSTIEHFLNDIKVRSFFGKKNIEKSTCADENRYLCKSNIPVIYFIVGSRNIINNLPEIVSFFNTVGKIR